MRSRNTLADTTRRDTLHQDVLEASQDPVADDLELIRGLKSFDRNILPAPHNEQWRVGNLVFSEPEPVPVLDAENIRKQTGVEIIGEAGRDVPGFEDCVDTIIVEIAGEPHRVNARRVGRCRTCYELIQFGGFCFRCGGALPSDDSSTRVVDTGDILPLNVMNGIRALSFDWGSWYAAIERADGAHMEVVNLAECFDDQDWQVHPRVVRDEFWDVLGHDGGPSEIATRMSNVPIIDDDAGKPDAKISQDESG